MFKNHPVYNARSAGTSDKARVKVNEKLIDWADVVFVMERKHRDILKHGFASALAGKELVVLDIEDNYQFNDPELVAILQDALREYLES